jgi:predicted HTH transcriptional regulator
VLFVLTSYCPLKGSTPFPIDYSIEITPFPYIFAPIITPFPEPHAGLRKIFVCQNTPESFGTGLKRIADACNEAGVKYEFVPGKLGFTVIFYRPKIQMADNMVDKMVGKLKKEDRYVVIINYLKTHEYITTTTIMDLLDVSNTTAKRVAREMSDQSLLIPQGDRKARKYYLTK